MKNFHQSDTHIFGSHNNDPVLLKTVNNKKSFNLEGVLNVINSPTTQASILINGIPISTSTSYSLYNLTNVNVDTGTLIDDQFLRYDSGTSKWINETVNYSTITTLSSLQDVGLLSLHHDQVLQYSTITGKWENNLLSYSTITTLSGLQDVQITSQLEDQFLKWTSNNKYENITFTLNNIEQFNISNVTQNDVLRFTSNMFWENSQLIYNLSDLNDVNITPPLNDNQVIKYQLSGNKWINVDPTTYSSVYSINDLNDVSVTTTLTDGQILAYSGTQFVNIFPVTYSASLAGLTDVLLTNTTHYDFLRYTTNEKWENQEVFIPTLLEQLIDVEFSSVSAMNIMIATSGPTRWINSVNSLNFCTEVQLGTLTSGDILTYTNGKIRSLAFNKSIDDLNDVSIVTPSSNDLLTYTDSQWKSMPFNRSIDDLNDVNIVTPLTNQILTYTDSQWKNMPFDRSIVDLNDVPSFPIGSGYYLGYNNISGNCQWKNINTEISGTTVPIDFPSGFLFVGGILVIPISLSSINDLSDVQITAVTRDQYLKYTSNNQWENVSISPFP